MSARCKRCGGTGHYAKTCTRAGVGPKPRVVAAAPAPVAKRPPADHPYSHIRREQHGPGTPDLPGYVHTWQHRETGASIVATFPPFSWGDLDGMVVLRHIRDAAQIAKAHPRAVVSTR